MMACFGVHHRVTGTSGLAPVAVASGSGGTAASGSQQMHLHNRHECPTKAFSRDRSASNASHCQSCLCYVCGVEAARCRHWGEGKLSSAPC